MTASGYDLQSYGRMIDCEPRMPAFAEALRRSITPGCHVIDLGAGPGLFAMLACQYGAGSVVAIEPDPSIELARQIAAANGFADRIIFVRDLSTAYQPEQRADVVVSDIRGCMPLFEHHIPITVDTRARLLKVGGVQIPGVDRVFATLVEAPEKHAEYISPWAESPYGVDLSEVLPFSVNNWGRTFLPPTALLTDPVLFATIDYRTVTEPSHRAAIEWTVRRPGTVHGILMWFETELVPGVGYSNAPGQPELVYGQAFFPLERAVTMAEGASARADVAATYVKGQYVWSWSFAATDAMGERQAFRQSSFKGQILGAADLAPRASTFRPPAREVQAVDAACLGLFDGQLTLAEIASELHERFPHYFSDAGAAFDHVAALSARYNR